jgi:hypothetical protein
MATSVDVYAASRGGSFHPIPHSLSEFLAERFSTHPQDEQGKAADRRQAEVYGKKQLQCQREMQSKADATAALAAEKLKEIKL